MNKTILVASRNQGKINEYQHMLQQAGYEVIGLDEIGYTQEIEEVHDTYKDNAIAKVDALADVFDGIIIGDDSGFEIAALDFKPGVHSARFMSEFSYQEKNEYILEQLKEVEDRSCAFVCAIACLKDNRMWVTINRAFGNVSERVEAGRGFGYDPIFVPLGYDKPFSLLDETIKNSISHRALATQALIQYLENS